MNLNKFRFLIIIALVVLNLFLLASIFGITSSNKQLSEDTVEYASVALKRKNIDISPDKIERTIPDDAVYEASAYKIPQNLSETLKNFFLTSEKFSINEKSYVSEYDVPGGYSMEFGTEKSSSGIKNQYSYMTLREDLEFSYSVYGYEGLRQADFEEKEIQTHRYIKKIDAFFTLFSDNITFEEIQSGIVGENEFVAVARTLNGKCIENCNLTFVFSGDEAVLVFGNWFFDGFEKKYRYDFADSIDILYAIKNTDSITVEKEELVYVYALKKNSKDFYIVPAWDITYTDSDGNTVNNIYDSVGLNKISR